MVKLKERWSHVRFGRIGHWIFPIIWQYDLSRGLGQCKPDLFRALLI